MGIVAFLSQKISTSLLQQGHAFLSSAKLNFLSRFHWLNTYPLSPNFHELNCLCLSSGLSFKKGHGASLALLFRHSTTPKLQRSPESMSRKQQDASIIISPFIYNEIDVNDDDGIPTSGQTTPRGPSPPLSDTQSYVTALESPDFSVVGSDGGSDSTAEEYTSAEENLTVS